MKQPAYVPTFFQFSTYKGKLSSVFSALKMWTWLKCQPVPNIGLFWRIVTENYRAILWLDLISCVFELHRRSRHVLPTAISIETWLKVKLELWHVHATSFACCDTVTGCRMCKISFMHSLLVSEYQKGKYKDPWQSCCNIFCCTSTTGSVVLLMIV